jgi:hypothetical protein
LTTPLAAGGLLRGRVWTRYADERQAAVNTVHYFVSAVGTTPATDDDAALALHDIIHLSYPPLMSSLTSYRGVQMQILSPIPPFQALFVEGFFGDDILGTSGETSLPSQTCGLVEYQTGAARQRGRGRSYLAFPATANDDGTGKPSAGGRAAMLAIASDLSAGLSVSRDGRTATLVRVLKHGKDKDHVQIFPYWTAVTGHSVSVFWATQKKRGNWGRSNLSPL